MEERELLKQTVGEVCNIFGADPLTKHTITNHILNESEGKDEEIKKCIERIHDLIHRYNLERYKDLSMKNP